MRLREGLSFPFPSVKFCSNSLETSGFLWLCSQAALPLCVSHFQCVTRLTSYFACLVTSENTGLVQGGFKKGKCTKNTVKGSGRSPSCSDKSGHCVCDTSGYPNHIPLPQAVQCCAHDWHGVPLCCVCISGIVCSVQRSPNACPRFGEMHKPVPMIE